MKADGPMKYLEVVGARICLSAIQALVSRHLDVKVSDRIRAMDRSRMRVHNRAIRRVHLSMLQRVLEQSP